MILNMCFSANEIIELSMLPFLSVYHFFFLNLSAICIDLHLPTSAAVGYMTVNRECRVSRAARQTRFDALADVWDFYYAAWPYAATRLQLCNSWRGVLA